MAKRMHEYDGEGIRVRYDVGRCIHAAECVRTLPQVFDPQRRPWVDPDAAEVVAVVEAVVRCPTGALQAEWQGNSTEAPGGGEENLLTVSPDGPLYARGDVRISTPDGEEILRDTRVAFCRCGASKIKPFCDGSHSEAQFRDEGSFGEPKLRGSGEGEGPLRVTVTSKGPLVIKGPVKVVAGKDLSSQRGERGAFCRCGASRNKPFCDGQHTEIGFDD